MSISSTGCTAPREYQDGSVVAGSLVAVIGPPGAGKTTVVTALAQPRRLPVFRLREAVIAYADRLIDLVPTTDPLGWVGVQAVDRILRASFIDGKFDTGIGPVLLDNFPGTDRALLGRLANHITENPALAGLCEHYDILDKLVLHDDPSGWRLRLHVFLDGYFDRLHNHRWTYASRILPGHMRTRSTASTKTSPMKSMWRLPPMSSPLGRIRRHVHPAPQHDPFCGGAR